MTYLNSNLDTQPDCAGADAADVSVIAANLGCCRRHVEENLTVDKMTEGSEKAYE
jgi:hypothetical protein